MALTIYSFPGDFRALKALIAAQYSGVEVHRPDFELGKDNLTPEFLAKNPQGKVPLLETPQGCIFESNAIARYVGRIRRDTELAGRTFFESGQVDAWLDFCSHEVELPATMWIYPILGYMEFKAAVHAKAVEDLHKALAALERHLLLRTYVVGEAVTLADVVLVCALFYPFKLVLDEAARAPYPSVTRWFVTCVNQAQFRAVLGDVPLCETALVAVGGTPAPAPKAAAPAPAAAAAPKAEKAKKEEMPKEEKKKEEKPKKKEADEDAPEEDELTREAPKNDPFAALPKSTLNLDEWKRTYSNAKAADGKYNYYLAMPWFWEHLDSSEGGYALWHQKYKYNAENKRDFMTSNLVSGFVQRCDEMRKHSFGLMHVLGEAAPYEVEGVWMMRGHDVKAMMDSNPDAEYYEWIKLDPKNEAHKKLVEEEWCADAKIQGKTIYDSKTFK